MRLELPQAVRCEGPVELHVAGAAARARPAARHQEPLARLRAQPRRRHVAGKAPRQARH